MRHDDDRNPMRHLGWFRDPTFAAIVVAVVWTAVALWIGIAGR